MKTKTAPRPRHLLPSILSRPRPGLLQGLTFCCLVCFTLAGAACTNGGKVKLPPSDATPPSIVWNVFNHGTQAQGDHPGSPSLGAQRGEAYRVLLKAADPQGVQSIQLNPTVGSGELAWQCVDQPGGENLAQNKTATLGPMSQTLAPDGDGNVLTSIFLIEELDFTMPCPAGWSFGGGTAKLTGRASNYYGGTTTEVLTFQISP